MRKRDVPPGIGNTNTGEGKKPVKKLVTEGEIEKRKNDPKTVEEAKLLIAKLEKQKEEENANKDKELSKEEELNKEKLLTLTKQGLEKAGYSAEEIEKITKSANPKETLEQIEKEIEVDKAAEEAAKVNTPTQAVNAEKDKGKTKGTATVMKKNTGKAVAGTKAPGKTDQEKDEAAKLLKDQQEAVAAKLLQEQQEAEAEKERKEKEKTPEVIEAERKLEETREKFISEYKKCKKEADKQLLIEKTRTATFNILAGVKNLFSKNKIEKIKKEIQPEDFFTKETTEAKAKYDKTRKELGEKLFEQKKAKLEEAGLNGEELKTALTQYKATEVLAKTFEEEKQKIINAKAEGKPAAWKRCIDWYMKIQPRWKRVALSTLVFLPLSATGAMGAAAIGAGGYVVGITGLAAVKFGASMAIGAGVGHLAKGVDLIKRKSDQKFAEDHDNKKSELRDNFSNGVINQEEYEAGIRALEKEEKDRTRNRMLTKGVVGGALAIIGGYAAYNTLGYGLDHIGESHNNIPHGGSGAKIENMKAGSVNHPPLKDIPPYNNEFKIKYPFPIDEDNPIKGQGPLRLPEDIKMVPHANVEAVANNGQGAISTLKELQQHLKVEYGNDLEHAPASVKHILNTDAHKLAQEYGMYKPGESAESAMIRAGSAFRVDGSGNVVYHEVNGSDITLEKGIELKASNTFHGNMFDSDHAGSVNASVEGEVIDTPHFNPDQNYDMHSGDNLDTTNIDNGNVSLDTNLDSNVGNNTEEITNTPHHQDLHSDGVINTKPSVEELLSTTKEVIMNYENNINHLFPTEESMETFDYIKKNVSAERLFEMGRNGEISDAYKPLISHMNKIEEISGLKPIGESLISEAETIPTFIYRASKEIAEMGRLDEIKLTEDAVPVSSTPDMPSYVRPNK